MSQPAPQAPTQTPKNPTTKVQTLRLWTQLIIALVGLLFSAYLFWLHQATIGGALAGMILGHFFGLAHTTTGSDVLAQAVSSVGGLLGGQKGGS